MTDRPDMAPAIDALELTHRFGHETLAVDGVSLTVAPGEVFGLVGPDGAGKSTLIRMLATVLYPTAGDARIFGASVLHEAKAIKPRIGYMSQRFSLYGDLTVRENLTFFAELRGVPRHEVYPRGQRLLEFMGIDEFADRRAEYLSGGMKQKLALAATLIHEPDLLFLDEPTTGVDPVSRREFWRIIAELHQRGITVFVATPYMDEAERCSKVAFMDRGDILFADTPAGLKRRVPGTAYEVVCDRQRAVLAGLQSLPGISSAFVFGDVVRVTAVQGGPGPAEIGHAAEDAGGGHVRVSEMRVDMEAAFAYLVGEAQTARAGARTDRTAEDADTDADTAETPPADAGTAGEVE